VEKRIPRAQVFTGNPRASYLFLGGGEDGLKRCEKRCKGLRLHECGQRQFHHLSFTFSKEFGRLVVEALCFFLPSRVRVKVRVRFRISVSVGSLGGESALLSPYHSSALLKWDRCW
jgi:hypothetical protein